MRSTLSGQWRSRLIGLAMGLAFAATTTVTAGVAETYPSRNVTLIIPYPAGGGVDTEGRLIAAKLGDRLGQQVVVENRPGAGAVIGVRAAAKSAPDGYTLLLMVTGMGVMPNAGYDLSKDFAPIGLIATIPIVVMAHPSVPAKTIADVLALAKMEPGTLTVGTPPAPTLNYFGAESFKAITKADITIVTYRGTGPLTNDLVGGHIKLAFNTLPPAIGNIQAGKLNAIAVAARERLAAIPDVPTVSESGLPGFEVVQYYGLAAPAGTPDEIVRRLNSELRAIVAAEDVRNRIIADGGGPLSSSPEEYAANIAREEARWAGIVRQLGLKVE